MSDIWSNWLLKDRLGHDASYSAVVSQRVTGYVDRVLDAAHIKPGEVLLDVGTGEGVLALRALERLGGELTVVMTDISATLLEVSRTNVLQRHFEDHCHLIQASAESLKGVGDSSVDVVAMRAVLAYVGDKALAFTEFNRVLKPGGRLSMGEPIFMDESVAARTLRIQMEGAQSDPEAQLLALLHKWKSSQFPDSFETQAATPIVSFSERDLVELAIMNGFVDVHLEFHIDVRPSPIKSWQTFLDTSPHPLAPTLRTIMATRFSVEERELFEQLIRPGVEAGRNAETERIAYLSARKPGS